MLGKAAYFLHLSFALFAKYWLLGKAAYFLHLSVALFVKYLLPEKAAYFLHLQYHLHYLSNICCWGKLLIFCIYLSHYSWPSQSIHHHPPVAEPLISQLGPSHAETPIASLHHARSTLLHAKTCLWIQIRSTF